MQSKGCQQGKEAQKCEVKGRFCRKNKMAAVTYRTAVNGEKVMMEGWSRATGEGIAAVAGLDLTVGTNSSGRAAGKPPRRGKMWEDNTRHKFCRCAAKRSLPWTREQQRWTLMPSQILLPTGGTFISAERSRFSCPALSTGARTNRVCSGSLWNLIYFFEIHCLKCRWLVLPKSHQTSSSACAEHKAKFLLHIFHWNLSGLNSVNRGATISHNTVCRQ